MPTDQSSSDTEHPVPSASESATTTGPQQKQTPHGPKRAVKIIGLIILLLIIGLIIYGLWKAYQPRSVA
ncbi:MAG: HlyD family secretion protein, partial [Acinetobacter sp.]